MSLREQKGLVENLKELIIRTLRLEDVGPEDIVASEPLFGEGLGLDSIDFEGFDTKFAFEELKELLASSQIEGRQ